jgi:hypothetical protein
MIPMLDLLEMALLGVCKSEILFRCMREICVNPPVLRGEQRCDLIHHLIDDLLSKLARYPLLVHHHPERSPNTNVVIGSAEPAKLLWEVLAPKARDRPDGHAATPRDPGSAGFSALQLSVVTPGAFGRDKEDAIVFQGFETAPQGRDVDLIPPDRNEVPQIEELAIEHVIPIFPLREANAEVTTDTRVDHRQLKEVDVIDDDDDGAFKGDALKVIRVDLEKELGQAAHDCVDDEPEGLSGFHGSL